MRENILIRVEKILKMYQDGLLGGEIMPEDENPKLERGSLENYLYFTLPMALNYQRNSYTLWKSALNTWKDEATRFVFFPEQVLTSSFSEVQAALVKYKLALQPQKQTEIWIRLCETIVHFFNGDIRNLFSQFGCDVVQIRTFIQKIHKKEFPYLSGIKICNYWLYVIYQYTDCRYTHLEKLTVAPDTHVVKASYQLGLINDDELSKNNVQEIVIERWNEILKGTRWNPIDIHTPLWLWSRSGFLEEGK